MKKNILIIGLSDNIGGIETFMMNYYREFDKNKYNFDFVSLFGKLAFEDEIVANGSNIIKITNFKNNPIKYYKELNKVMKNGKYDAIHINMLSAANILPISIAKKNNIKNIIVHSHNGGTPKGLTRNLLHNLNKKYIIKNATTFLACSKLAGEWLFGKKTKFDIINNAIYLEKFKYSVSNRNKIRKKYNIDDEDIVFGHVGRFFEQKNHKYLIDVFYELNLINSKSKLLLIGDGELKEKIKEKVSKLGMEKKVIFTGAISEVNEYYSAMDAFILPSIFEGSPMVLIEAQTAGLPCYISNEITNETKIIDNVEFFSIKDEPQKIAEFISNNINDVNINRNKCYELMLNSRYNIKKESSRLIKYYE